MQKKTAKFCEILTFAKLRIKPPIEKKGEKPKSSQKIVTCERVTVEPSCSEPRSSIATRVAVGVNP